MQEIILTWHFKNFTSIFILRDMLDKANIPYVFKDRSYLTGDITTIHYQIIVDKPNSEEMLISVVEGNYTYGGNEDLLEIMGCLTKKELKKDNVVGYLTPRQVFKRIKKNYKKLLKEGD